MVEKDLQTIRHILSLIGENTTVSHPENVRDESQVTGCARVLDNALLLERAKIGWDVVVSEQAVIRGDSVLIGTARVSGSAQVVDSDVFGDTRISGCAMVMGQSNVRDSIIEDQARVDNSNISRSHISGSAFVEFRELFDSVLTGNVRLTEDDDDTTPIRGIHWWSDVP